MSDNVRRSPRSLLLAACAVLAFVLPGEADTKAPPPVKGRPVAFKDKDAAKDNGKEKDKEMPAPKFIGAQLCSNCHTEPGANPADFVRLTEFKTWRLQDKHSQSYAILVGPRGKRMAELLGQDVTKPETGCLGCHALDVPLERQPKTLNILQDGVTCEACHGASEYWLGPHVVPGWREKTAPEKSKLGMKNLRDQSVQAKLCISCHIGNAAEGKVVTHAMFAAGHPILPSFDAAEFVENMPRHWEYTRNIPWLQKNGNAAARKSYEWDEREFQQTKLLLASSVMGLRESARLLQGRAAAGAEYDRKRWPELLDDKAKWAGMTTLKQNWPEVVMPHLDCMACHHDLQRPSWRQKRGYKDKGAPGRPFLPVWTRTLLPGVNGNGAGKPAAVAELDASCGQFAFGQPEPMSKAAEKVKTYCDGLLEKIEKTPLTRAGAIKLLNTYVDLGLSGTPDFDSARLIASAVNVIYSELNPTNGDKSPTKASLAKLMTYLNLDGYPNKPEREAIVWDIVEAKGGKGVEGIRKASASGAGGNVIGNALASMPYVKRLSDSNEKALSVMYKQTSAYQPAEFQDMLRAIKKGLPEK